MIRNKNADKLHKRKKSYALDNLRNTTGALVIGIGHVLHHGRVDSYFIGHRHRGAARSHHQR